MFRSLREIARSSIQAVGERVKETVGQSVERTRLRLEATISDIRYRFGIQSQDDADFIDDIEEDQQQNFVQEQQQVQQEMIDAVEESLAELEGEVSQEDADASWDDPYYDAIQELVDAGFSFEDAETLVGEEITLLPASQAPSSDKRKSRALAFPSDVMKFTRPIPKYALMGITHYRGMYYVYFN